MGPMAWPKRPIYDERGLGSGRMLAPSRPSQWIARRAQVRSIWHITCDVKLHTTQHGIWYVIKFYRLISKQLYINSLFHKKPTCLTIKSAGWKPSLKWMTSRCLLATIPCTRIPLLLHLSGREWTNYLKPRYVLWPDKCWPTRGKGVTILFLGSQGCVFRRLLVIYKIFMNQPVTVAAGDHCRFFLPDLNKKNGDGDADHFLDTWPHPNQ